MSQEVFNEVQAALLNSECPPDDAVDAAMLAVMQFFMTELDGADDIEAVEVAKKALARGKREKLW